MTGRRPGPATVAVVVVALVALSLLAFAPTAAADPHENGSSAYAITQGEQCIDVTPIVDESQSVETFYDYRWNGTGQDFSSYGTKPYQEDDTSTLLLYEGSSGTSLVFVHEKHYENPEEGTNGSFATFGVSGLPAGEEGWVVEDDDYDEQVDVFNHTGTESELQWAWSQGRTDGAAYRGLSGDVSITIDPAFNDSAVQLVNPDNSPSYNGTVEDWDVVTGAADGTDREQFDSLTESVTIESGYCTPPNASLSVSNATPKAGQSVTLDASNATSSAAVTEYRWDTDGDGTTDVTTTTPVIDHAFQRAGPRTVTVTVDDGYESGVASVDVNVSDETPPTAQIATNGTTAATKPLAFSANESADNGAIVSYEWQFGVGETTNGSNVTHTYATAGEYDVQLTVTDSAGNVNSTNATVTVTDPPGPVASLVALDATTVNETVSFDASGSETGPNASYAWSIDGTPINATGPTLQHPFETPDTYNVSVTVSDDYGTDTNATTIEVFAPPVAVIDANRTTAETGEAIAFEAGQSSENVVGYNWTFADGGTGSNETEIHRFDEAGNYTVTLTVVNAAGNTNSTTETVQIDLAAPTAQLNASGSVALNETVTFDASGSTGAISSYHWRFDDGETASTDGATVDHAYSTPGEYTVELTAVGEGGNDTATTTVTVSDGTSGGNESDGDDGDQSEGGGSDESDSGDAGSGSSGSGGYAPAPDPDPVETTVGRTNGTVVVTVENARANEAVEVDVPVGGSDAGTPAGETVEGEGGAGAGAVELRSLELVPAHDADELTVRFEPAHRPVPGRFSQPAAYVPNATAELADVTYEFAVDPNATAAAGVSAANLTAYADDGGWQAAETSVDAAGANENEIVLTTTLTGETPVGVGSDGAALFVRSVETVGSVADGTVELAITAQNTGNESGEWTIPIEAGGETVHEASVVIAPGEETVVTANVEIGAMAGVGGTGSTGVTVAGARRDLAVVSVTSFELSQTEPAPEETVTVDATLRNRGNAAGEFDVALRLDGETVATETIRLDAEQRTTVSFDHQFAESGRYELAIGNRTASVRVETRDSFDGNGEESSNATSGFGGVAAILAIVSLLALAVLGKRRSRP
ncbi:PKD domain-containing protein [Salinarchaeum laminariae]|uniref:PKD domain-containing protein n=1 Tax=Salinarchaeum laminariae TaxID=869888 RepID=UPI0020BD9C80|nr:PKD domain-containing protein [Salinarchaeum laminariae]